MPFTIKIFPDANILSDMKEALNIYLFFEISWPSKSEGSKKYKNKFL